MISNIISSPQKVAWKLVFAFTILLFSWITSASAGSPADDCQGTVKEGPHTKAVSAKCVGIVLGFVDVETPYDARELLTDNPIANLAHLQDFQMYSNQMVFNSELDSHIYIMYADYSTIENNAFVNSLYVASYLVKFDAEYGFLMNAWSKAYFKDSRQMCLLVMDEFGDGRMYISANNIVEDRRCFQTLFTKFMNTDLGTVTEIKRQVRRNG